jgi:hypothetical protein
MMYKVAALALVGYANAVKHEASGSGSSGSDATTEMPTTADPTAMWTTKTAELADAIANCVTAEAGSGSGDGEAKGRRAAHISCTAAMALYADVTTCAATEAGSGSGDRRERRAAHVEAAKMAYCTALDAAKAAYNAGTTTAATPTTPSSAAAMSFAGLASVVAYIM